MSSQSSPTGKTYSTRSSYSSTSTNRSVSRNGGPPETSSERRESSSSSTSGDSLLSPPFSDNFEDLKKSILNGDAYKRSRRIHQPMSAQRGQQHYKADEGSTTIRPTRVSTLTSSSGKTGGLPQQVASARSTYNSKLPQQVASERSTYNSKHSSLNSNNNYVSPPNVMSNYKTELYIPVRRHHGDFDDFFKSRWQEHNPSLMDSEFDRKRRDWESKLDDMKRDFFHFSPFVDHHQQHHYDASKAIQPFFNSFGNPFNNWHYHKTQTIKTQRKTCQTSTISVGPTGNPEFAVRFNVQDFKPEEINVSTKENRLTISAAHEERSGGTVSKRNFKRTVDIPSDVQIGLMRSTLSKDGILSITAPIKPPNYLPGTATHPALQSSSQVTQQHANALSTIPSPSSTSVVTREADSADALNYSLSIAGYQPEEISVTVEGRKVTVSAKHEENSGGRKVHNEMTKSFDLPPTVNPHHVRSYIKDGSTLFIEAQLRDNLAGKIHLVPVTHKYC